MLPDNNGISAVCSAMKYKKTKINYILILEIVYTYMCSDINLKNKTIALPILRSSSLTPMGVTYICQSIMHLMSMP